MKTIPDLYVYMQVYILRRPTIRGGDLGGLGGRSPKNWRWGTAHASVPPIF